MKITLRRIIILTVLALAAASFAMRLFHSDSEPTTPTNSAPVSQSPTPTQSSVNWNREVPMKLPTPGESYLAGVAPFLAHQFETPGPETTAQPTGTPVPSPSRIPSTPNTALFAKETPHPVIEGLKELSVLPSAEERGSRLYGVAKTTRDSEPAAPVAPTATVAPTGTPQGEFPRAYGQATGYTMLYLMHPRARLTVEGELRTILRANLDSVYLAALVDGTFQLDFPYLETVVRRLNGDGRKVTLVLYFSSGPTMRRFESTPITAGFAQIDPEYFRYLIRVDQDIRQDFINIVSRATAVYDLNKALNAANTNIAIVMLEDNLNVESYREMRDLAQGVLAGRAEIMRNPCPGCYSGNDSDSLGDALETHSASDLENIKSGDGFSLDGIGFASPTDDLGGQPSIEAIKIMKETAISRGARFFGLWRMERQGLGPNGQLTHPDDRVYEVPSQSQEDAEVGLLRHGLSTTAPNQ